MTTTTANRPVWIELATGDVAKAGSFYSNLFGWKVEASPDPQYGGYAMARTENGQDIAGIAPKQSPDEPTSWALYIGTDDAEQLSEKVKAANGSVVVPPFEVGDQGRMAVYQDPSGGFIRAWQSAAMDGFATTGDGAFAWAELNARGAEQAIPFYKEVFGWAGDASPMENGEYTVFTAGGEQVAGAMEVPPMVPAEVPSYWLVYLGADDVDATHRRAVELGARELVPPSDSPGGRFSVLADPDGAAFGLVKA